MANAVEMVLLKYVNCSFSVRDGKPEDLVGRIGSFLSDGGLIHSHKYYTQVQGQLEICRKTFCDFIVWTPKDTQGPTLC